MRELNCLKTEVITLETIEKVRKMVKAHRNGLMGRNIQETGAGTNSMGTASTSGLTDASTMDNGNKASSMEMESIVILTEGHIQENTAMATNMVLVLMSGTMVRLTKVTGRIIYSMDKEDGPMLLVRAKSESGSMVTEKNGYPAVSRRLRTLRFSLKSDDDC